MFDVFLTVLAKQVHVNINMDNLDIIDTLDLNNICRVCLKPYNDLQSIFQTINTNKKIMTCAVIQVNEFDGLPSQICKNCLSNLDVAYDFRKLCEHSDAILREYVSLHKADYSIKNELIESNKSSLGEYDSEQSMDIKEEEEWKISKSNKMKKNHSRLKISRKSHRRKIVPKENNISDTENEKSRRVMCEVCGKLLQTRTALELHMRTHTDERPYRCHECAKAFRQKPSLMNHIRTHSDERPFSCTICNKGCRTKQDLKVHMRCHTQEQPYKCKMCDRKFSTSSNLAKHVNVIHLNERKYKCTMCEAAFNIRFSLNKHIRWHESTDKSYLCPVCNKNIKRCNISLHIKRMHPEQSNVLPYTCRVCSMQFGNELGLQAHLRQLHSINTAIGQTVENPNGTIDKSNIPKL